MVVPSRYESFGLVALEAMARGIVVIAARIAASVGKLHAGCLTNPYDDEKLTSARGEIQGAVGGFITTL